MEERGAHAEERDAIGDGRVMGRTPMQKEVKGMTDGGGGLPVDPFFKNSHWALRNAVEYTAVLTLEKNGRERHQRRGERRHRRWSTETKENLQNCLLSNIRIPLISLSNSFLIPFPLTLLSLLSSPFAFTFSFFS